MFLFVERTSVSHSSGETEASLPHQANLDKLKT